MKKINYSLISISRLLWKSKLFRTMRVTLLMVLLGICQVFATNTYSQNSRLSLNLKNSSIKDVLKKVEDQSEFFFIYDASFVDVEKRVSVESKNALIPEILEEIFEGSDIVYKINDRQIALSSTGIENVGQQQKVITGTVIDEEGLPLPGVTVVEKGTANGAVTNINGRYTISVASNAVLIYSFIGYASKEVSVEGQSLLDISLSADLIALDEVVAVGYGVIKKRDITGSVGSISSEQLLASPITSLDAGLQGKIAGVTVQQTSGAPGESMKIRVRGGSSINYSNNPLYVIDGFIGADITTINPSDIATIDILKDASATAVYGSRGANGVILITTNAPTKGKFKISMDANVGVSSIVNKFDILTPVEQMELMNIQDVAAGNSPAFSEAQINEYRNGKHGTDWVDLITQQGIEQNYTLNATGGNDQLQYYVSANHLDQSGIIKDSFYKRTSLRSNIKAKITDKIDMAFNTYGVHVSSQANTQGTNGQRGNPIGYAAVMPQLWDSRDANGEFIDPNTYDSFSGTYQVGDLQNPEEQILQNQEDFNDRIISNLDLTFDLGHNLTLFVSNSGSYNSVYTGLRTLENPVSISRDDVTARQTYARNIRWMNTDILTYENDFGKHHLKASAVYEYSQVINRGITATVGALSTLANEWYLLANGAPSNTGSNYAKTTVRSYMGRVNYSFADKYLLTASMRADGTSLFNEDNRWGYFPSAALAWRASEESFIKNIAWIYNLKVRAGFGSTGNPAIGTRNPNVPISTPIPTLITTSQANQSFYPSITGELVSGLRVGALTNPNVKWETTTQYNFGVDFAMLGGRLSAVLDIYSKQTTDVIISKSIPRYTGYQAFTDNYADIDNNGFELGINWNVMNKSDFSWDINLNVSKNKNIVQSLGEDTEQIFVANEQPLGVYSLVGGNTKFVVREGESLGSFYGLRALGLWQLGEEEQAALYNSRPGEVKYEDVDEDNQYSASDRQIIGNAQPDYTYGIGTTLAYKGFDLSIQCVGSVGNEIYNFSDNILTQQARILSADYRDRWTPENPDATHQTMPVGNDYSMTYIVSQYVENGSFFKINNATLGYSLPKSLTNKLKISGVRLYMSANNLLTITKYSGLDPEGSSTLTNSDSQAGIDAFSYPLTRTVTGGVKVTF